jgi:NAD(P)-dependent dehydrogenase (short-subunit alcohol dehydrogenase family)
MTSERKVVVITGASRGIGAQLSKAYRHIGYQVIASSRSMRKSDDPAINETASGPSGGADHCDWFCRPTISSTDDGVLHRRLRQLRDQTSSASK